MTEQVEVRQEAHAILNRHCEYVDGLDRGQVWIGTDQALAAVIEALNARHAEQARLSSPQQEAETVDEERLIKRLRSLADDLVREEWDEDNEAASLVRAAIAALTRFTASENDRG